MQALQDIRGHGHVPQERKDRTFRDVPHLLKQENCHGMTFSDLSFHQDYPLVHCSWTDSLPFSLTFILSGIRKAERKGIYWRRTTMGGHLLLMWPWHLPPVDDLPTLSQLLHEIGVSPVYHNLKAG